MSKIIGNTTATPVPRSNWAQTDSSKADFILNKPNLGTKVNVSDVINNLTSTETKKPLSAAQGAALKALIDSLSEELANVKSSVVTVYSGSESAMTTAVGSDGDIYLVTE